MVDSVSPLGGRFLWGGRTDKHYLTDVTVDRTDNKVESFFHHEVFPRPACPSVRPYFRQSAGRRTDRPSASSSRCFLPHPPSCSWPSERAFYGAAGCIFDHLSLSLLFSSFLRSSAEFGGSGILGEKQKEGQARVRKEGRKEGRKDTARAAAQKYPLIFTEPCAAPGHPIICCTRLPHLVGKVAT